MNLKTRLALLSGTALRVPKKPGESCLKPAKNKTKCTSNLSTHTRHGPRCDGPRSPPEWPNHVTPRAGSASLEGLRPLERVPPRSRVPASLEQAPPRSRAHAPSSGSASLEGPRLPRAGSASLEAPSQARLLPHTGTGI
jgi:hypothetical protein